MEMFISFFTGKVMLFYGISLIMKEKSNASALVWDERRSRLGYETDESGTAFADKLGCRICDLCFLGGQVGCSKSRKIKIGREATAPLKGRAFKIEISKVSGSTLVAEICTDPHNRLLRRQHWSSLCSQSEGHEHVANI